MSERVLTKLSFYDRQLDLVAGGLQGCSRVIDLGVGYGRLARRLSGHSPVTGADINLPSCLYARGNAGSALVAACADVHALPFGEIFDGASCLSNLGAFSDPRAVISETFRVLLPGGRFALTGLGAETRETYTAASAGDLYALVRSGELSERDLEDLELHAPEGDAHEFRDGISVAVNMLEQEGFEIKDHERFYHHTMYFVLAEKPR